MAKVKETNCELCGKEAALRCEADSANLCYRCDAKVHGVNFLVARHVRVVLCCRCHQSTEISVSGPSPQAAQSFCFACCKSQGIKQTSHCTSTAESAFAGHVSSTFSNHSKGLRVGIDCKPVNDLRIAEGNMKACFREGVNEEAGTIERFEASIKEGDNEGTGAPGRSEVSINGWSYTAGASTTSSSGESQKEVSKPLVEIPKNEIDLLHTRSGRAVSNAEMQVKIVMSKWYRHLNLRSPSTLPLAMDFVEKGLQKLGALSRQKIRICLAASLWLAATLCEKQAYLPSVKKFEECSGVPSKLILLAESRLGRLLRLKAQEEGSAECSS